MACRAEITMLPIETRVEKEAVKSVAKHFAHTATLPDGMPDPDQGKLCCLITADTRTVLVDPALAKRVESRDRAQFPSWRDIMQNSVQIWASRLHPGKLPLLKQRAWRERFWPPGRSRPAPKPTPLMSPLPQQRRRIIC